MLSFNEYRRYDALGLAELVRKGEVTPEELLDIAIRRAEEVNPALNAIVHKLYDHGKEAARTAPRDAPFAGVPFLVKDLGMEVAGTPMNTGSKGYDGYVSKVDSFAVKKMKAAGLVIFGKTNTSEFGITPFVEPERFGPARNPWNTAHSTGGSSGGSGAAVAAGIVPLATGNDGGGSIRIPASCCGLFGLKPSRGRVSWAPITGEMWNGAAVENCLSRSVRDSAAYLDAIQGAAPGDPYQIAPPKRPYLEEVSTPPGRLRIGYTAAHTLGMSVDTACVAALHRTVEVLRSEGHMVEECALPYQREDLTEVFLVIVAAELAAELEVMSRHLGRKVRPSDVEAQTYAFNLLGRSYNAAEFAYARQRWAEITHRIAGFYEQYDLLLTPTLGLRPIRVGSLKTSASEQALMAVVNTLGLGKAIRSTINQLADKIYHYMPWTAFANITGQPSMSVPAGWTEEENLPIGVMFTGRFGEEDVLYRLAGQLEKAMPWGEMVAMGG